jgi:CubicO group peptidase (beta-lactamase class C family)
MEVRPDRSVDDVDAAVSLESTIKESPVRPQIIALLFLLTVCRRSPEAVLTAEEPRLPAVTEAMQSFVDRGEVAGVVTLVGQPGRLLHLDAQGFRDVAAADPMRVDDLFWIASMTKPMTCTALLTLQDDGKLSIDDPASKYLPEFAEVKLADGQPPRQPVLIRHLLTHTAGLGEIPRVKAPDTRTLAEQSRLLAAAPLQWEPGTKWQYGWGLQAIGRIIEVVSGEPFDAYMQRRIFAPLGMTRTSFHPTPELAARLALTYGYNEAMTELVASKNQYISTDSAVRQTPMPSGGLFSCARDVHRFYGCILNGGELDGVRIVSAAAVQQMTTPQTGDLKAGFIPGSAWGLGWCVVTESQGITESLSAGSFGHGGIFGTQVWADPQRGVVTVLLIQRKDLGNSDGSTIRKALHDAVARSISP